MSKKASPICPVCWSAYNDSTHLPLSTACQHTHCLTCLREHTLASHPDVEAPREGQLPTGKEIQCLKCQKRVNTDDLVIDRAALASVPFNLEDLLIAHDPPPKPRPSQSSTTSETTTASKKHPQNPSHDPGSSVHPADDLVPSRTNPGDEGSDGDQASSAHVKKDLQQGPIGWTLPPSPTTEASTMDPHHPHHHPHSQPGVVGWSVAPGHGNPQVPPHTGPYTQMPHPHGHPPHSHHDPHHSHHDHHHSHHDPHHSHHGSHPHHHHGHAVAAGAAGVAAGVGVTALATHKKKDKKHKKEKKKHKEGKKSKERRHRSSSTSSSSSSSSRSSKSSNSS